MATGEGRLVESWARVVLVAPWALRGV
jgi:hypothetical protein